MIEFVNLSIVILPIANVIITAENNANNVVIYVCCNIAVGFTIF